MNGWTISAEKIFASTLTPALQKMLCGDSAETATKIAAVYPDGTLESGFGTSGIMQASTGGSVDRCLSVWNQQAGFHGFVGISDTARGFNASFGKLDDAGGWDTAFDADGHVGYGTDLIIYGGGIMIPSSSYFLSVGIDTNAHKIQMVEVHRADATLDPGFNGGSPYYDQVGGSNNYMSDGKVVAIDGADKIYIAFGADSVARAPKTTVARFLANATLDTTFHTDGLAAAGPAVTDDSSSNIVLQTNEKPVRTYFDDGGNKFGLIRYTVDGRLDTTFATDGSYNSSTTGTPSSIITIPGSGWICMPGSDRTAGNGEDHLVECVWP